MIDCILSRSRILFKIAIRLSDRHGILSLGALAGTAQLLVSPTVVLVLVLVIVLMLVLVLVQDVGQIRPDPTPTRWEIDRLQRGGGGREGGVC